MEPATADFVPAPSDIPGLTVGPLDAQAIAVNIEPSRRQALLHTLSSNHFRRGFRKVWTQRATHIVQLEEAQEFETSSGATDQLRLSKYADQTFAGFKRFIDSSGIPESYGVTDFYSDNALWGNLVVFRKGNLVYIAGFIYAADSRPKAAVDLARAEYDFAPARTLADPSPQEQVTSALSAILGLAFIFLFAAAVTFPVWLLLRRRARRKRSAAAAFGLPPFSPDRQHWFDGSGWRDAATDIPPHAQRSDDGNYWWDGASWRLIPRMSGGQPLFVAPPPPAPSIPPPPTQTS
jgi:hypothetical protein